MQVKKIAHLTKCLELQLTRAKAEGIVSQFTQGISGSLTWGNCREGSARYLVLWLLNKMHAGTQIPSRPQAAN